MCLTVLPYRVVIFPSRKTSAATTSANSWVTISGTLGETSPVPIPHGALEFVFRVSEVLYNVVMLQQKLYYDVTKLLCYSTRILVSSQLWGLDTITLGHLLNGWWNMWWCAMRWQDTCTSEWKNWSYWCEWDLQIRLEMSFLFNLENCHLETGPLFLRKYIMLTWVEIVCHRIELCDRRIWLQWCIFGFLLVVLILIFQICV
jgi:hypothetical protein